jgi:hypothetical protein
MVGIYDNNPYQELYNNLIKYIYNYLNNNDLNNYEDIDNIAKLILINNGCEISDNAIGKISKIMDNNYGLYFIIGGSGNRINQSYDLIEINGMPYLIIFLDYFKDINYKYNGNDPIKISEQSIMGKYNYYNELVKISQAFVNSIHNSSYSNNELNTTAIGNICRNIPIIIAGNIIYNICGEITENDVETDYEFINNIISNGLFKLSLYGIYEY